MQQTLRSGQPKGRWTRPDQHAHRATLGTQQQTAAKSNRQHSARRGRQRAERGTCACASRMLHVPTNASCARLHEKLSTEKSNADVQHTASHHISSRSRPRSRRCTLVRVLNTGAPVADADMPNLYALAFKLLLHACAAVLLILSDASTHTRHVRYVALTWYIAERIRELAMDMSGYDTYHAIEVCWFECIDTR